MFLGGGGGLEEVRLLLESLAALGVGRAQGCGLLLQLRGCGGSFVAQLGRGDGGRCVGAGVAGGHGRGGQREARAAAEKTGAGNGVEKSGSRGSRGGKQAQDLD